jgi:hypothetical protein
MEPYVSIFKRSAVTPQEAGLQPLYAFRKAACNHPYDCDPLTVKFEYVSGHKLCGLFGFWGNPVAERWTETTYPKLIQHIKQLEFGERATSMYANDRSAHLTALIEMAEEIERTQGLDFEDDDLACNPFAAHGL